MYDLLIKGGRVIDPAQNIDDTLDVAINGNKIAVVAREIQAQEGQRVVDAGDKIVTPGLIDAHCHCSGGIINNGVDPDDIGVTQGVTTLVDAGSLGEAIFGAFRKYVIPSSRTSVFCFLHLSSQGLSISPEMMDWKEINIEATEATIESNLDFIKGVKIRLMGNILASDGVEVIKLAKKVARKFGLPLMAHIGDRGRKVPASLTQKLLPLMEEGDILSHVFTAKQGGIMRSDGTILPELKEAMERGVILDIAHGRFNFSFDIARKGLAQGILPTTITSDVTVQTLYGPVYGMTVVMSKLMALGMDLNQIIQMSTINSARTFRAEDRIGSLKPGMDADVSILEILHGKWSLVDAEQQTLETTRLISPSMTIKSGELIPAAPVSQPQPLD
ncbi:amidohydrolase/deacetylase family metallohydrolase [Chloroflexota bacterium]